MITPIILPPSKPPAYSIRTYPADRLPQVGIYEPQSLHPDQKPVFYVDVDADLVRQSVPEGTKLVVGSRNTVRISSKTPPRIYTDRPERLVKQREIMLATNRRLDEAFRDEILGVDFDIFPIDTPFSRYVGYTGCTLRNIHLQ